jgi:hypothetical protein
MLLRQSPATSLLLKQIGVAVVASAVIIASAQAIVGSKSSAGATVVNGKLLNGTTTVEKAVRPGKNV